MSKGVLVPLDNSPRSWDAFRYALEEHPNAEIVALHVIIPIHTVLKRNVYGGERKRSEEEAEKFVSRI